MMFRVHFVICVAWCASQVTAYWIGIAPYANDNIVLKFNSADPTVCNSLNDIAGGVQSFGILNNESPTQAVNSGNVKGLAFFDDPNCGQEANTQITVGVTFYDRLPGAQILSFNAINIDGRRLKSYKAFDPAELEWSDLYGEAGSSSIAIKEGTAIRYSNAIQFPKRNSDVALSPTRARRLEIAKDLLTSELKKIKRASSKVTPRVRQNQAALRANIPSRPQSQLTTSVYEPTSNLEKRPGNIDLDISGEVLPGEEPDKRIKADATDQILTEDDNAMPPPKFPTRRLADRTRSQIPSSGGRRASLQQARNENPFENGSIGAEEDSQNSFLYNAPKAIREIIQQIQAQRGNPSQQNQANLISPEDVNETEDDEDVSQFEPFNIHLLVDNYFPSATETQLQTAVPNSDDFLLQSQSLAEDDRDDIFLGTLATENRPLGISPTKMDIDKYLRGLETERSNSINAGDTLGDPDLVLSSIDQSNLDVTNPEEKASLLELLLSPRASRNRNFYQPPPPRGRTSGRQNRGSNSRNNSGSGRSADAPNPVDEDLGEEAGPAANTRRRQRQRQRPQNNQISATTSLESLPEPQEDLNEQETVTSGPINLPPIESVEEALRPQQPGIVPAIEQKIPQNSLNNEIVVENENQGASAVPLEEEELDDPEVTQLMQEISLAEETLQNIRNTLTENEQTYSNGRNAMQTQIDAIQREIEEKLRQSQVFANQMRADTDNYHATRIEQARNMAAQEERIRIYQQRVQDRQNARGQGQSGNRSLSKGASRR